MAKAVKTDVVANDANDKQVANGENQNVATETAQTATASKPAEPVYDSEKLQELKAEGAQLWEKMTQCEPGSVEANDALLAVYKNKNEQAAEVARIKADLAHKAIAEKRNAKIAELQALLDAHTANVAVQASDAPNEVKDEANAAFKSQFDAIANELCLRIGGTVAPKTDKPAATGGNGGGKIKEAIEAAFIKNRADGMSDTENIKAIIASGYSRGTTGAVVLAWRRAQGEA